MLIYAVAILALLVLATYKELLSFVGLRRLVIINLCCSALGVFCSILSCTHLIPIDPTSIILTRRTVSLHQTWTTNAILASFVFDVIGGGQTTLVMGVTTCIAVLSPPEEL